MLRGCHPENNIHWLFLVLCSEPKYFSSMIFDYLTRWIMTAIHLDTPTLDSTPYGSLCGYDKRFRNRPTNYPDADEDTS